MESAPLQSVALVTGGIRGLGLATARLLAAQGKQVHITYRESGERAAKRQPEFPGRIHQVDLAEPAEAARLVQVVWQQDGRLDSLVHAVGGYDTGQASDAELLTAMWQSNVMTAMHMAAAARAAIESSQGAMVFFGCAGLEGHGPRQDSAAYAAAKSALLVLVKSLAVELALSGARANMISPGLIPHDAAHAGTLSEELLAKIPMGRVGRPEEVAAMAAFLISGQSAYTTGANIPVSGGWMI